MAELNTYGDLKKAIKIISLKQKGEKIGKVGVDVILNVIPGIGAAKTTFDFVKAAFKKPDTKKSDSWLDNLDIDDEVSAIVDDTVENGFLKAIAKAIDSEPDDSPLADDFNMNQKLVDYLKDRHKGRTVAGVEESKYNTMKKSELKLLIKENVINFLEQEEETTSEKVTIPAAIKPLIQQLNPDIDMTIFATALGKIAKGKENNLNLKEKNLLTDTFISLMKSSDTTLIQKLTTVFKQIK